MQRSPLAWRAKRLPHVLRSCIAVIAALAIAACGGGGATAPKNPSAPTNFEGVIAGSADESGVIALTTAATTATVTIHIVSTAQAAEAAVVLNLTGTLRIGNGANISLTGSFDAPTGAIAASGGGYTFIGILSTGAMTGTYSGPNGSGTFAALP